MKTAHEKGAYDALHARQRAEAEARHEALRLKGPAGATKLKRRLTSNKSSKDCKKRKKQKGEALAREETELTEWCAALLVQLERGGSTVLDDDGAGAFPEDEERIKALVAAKEREQDKTKKKNLKDKVRRARQALASKVLQRRVALLETRVAELEEEMRAPAAA